MYVVTDNRKQFEQNLRDLCLHKSYNTETNPGSVENIILTDRNICLVKQMDILSYFLYYHQKSRNLEDIKLREYVSFIRKERNRLFPNSYSNKPRKFISNQFFVRSSTLDDYINIYALNNCADRARINSLKELTNKTHLVRKGFKKEIDSETHIHKAKKHETNDERILRLLGNEYDIRITNTDEAIGMLESDVVHGNQSNDVIVLIKK